MKKFISTAVLILSMLVMTACNRVAPGEVGVKVIQTGASAGVQAQELGVGTHMLGLYEDMIIFPTTTTTETWSNVEGAGGPKISFTNADGVRTEIGVSMQFRVDPTKASDLVQKYRLGMSDIIDGPVRRRIQGAFNTYGVKYNSEQLSTGGANQLLTDIWTVVKDSLAQEGIVVENIEMVGSVGLPESIMNRINEKVEAQQNAQTATSQLEVTKAEAAQRIEESRGRAEALAVEGAALRANPEVLRLREIERWNGLCPLGTSSCVIGANANAIVGK